MIDETRSEVFVVADELVGGKPAHQLVGLDTATGKSELNQSVDPEGSTPAALLQRTGLTLDTGRVVFGYGGNYGDCSSYHGWVVSVPEGGGTPREFTVDAAPGESQGAIWMGGAAPVVDGGGNIWVSAGNGSVTSSDHAYDNSDSVLELSPSLTLHQYFAPSSWAADNAGDLDLSTAPALLADGQVVAAGKSRIAYLLNGSSLGGIGNQEAALGGACGDDIDGGVAFEGTTVYLPCLSGTVAVTASSPDHLRLLWSADSRRRTADPRGRTGLDHRPGRRALRPQAFDGDAAGTGDDRCACEPLPDRLGGRRPPPRPGGQPCGRVLGAGRRDGRNDHDDGCRRDDHQSTRHDDLGTGARGRSEPLGHRGVGRRCAGRRRRGELAAAAPAAGRGPRRPSVSRQQQLEDGAHPGHDERDGHDDGRDLDQRPVHRLPLADIVELVEQVQVVAFRPAGLLGHARTLVDGSGLARRQVADERPQTLGKVRLGRPGEMPLHRLPR